MWKKGDSMSDSEPETSEPVARRNAPRASSGGAERATIGRSITIKGEVTGDEDLLIQGTVDGSIDLKQHSVTVGPEGEVNADITGRVVTVEGVVDGDLTGHDQVILRSSAKVKGDIKAPRVILEDGANFRGGVDMGSSSSGGREAERSSPTRASAPSPASSSGSSSSQMPSGASSSSAGGSSDKTEKATT